MFDSRTISAAMLACQRFYRLALPFEYCSILLDYNERKICIKSSKVTIRERSTRGQVESLLFKQGEPVKYIQQLSIKLAHTSPGSRTPFRDEDLLVRLLSSIHDLEILS